MLLLQRQAITTSLLTTTTTCTPHDDDKKDVDKHDVAMLLMPMLMQNLQVVMIHVARDNCGRPTFSAGTGELQKQKQEDKNVAIQLRQDVHQEHPFSPWKDYSFART